MERLNIEELLIKYRIEHKKIDSSSIDLYVIDNKVCTFIEIQDVNNEPHNLRIQSNNQLKNVVKHNLSVGLESKKYISVYAYREIEEELYFAIFSESLFDQELPEGNKSLKFKKIDLLSAEESIYKDGTSKMKYDCKFTKYTLSSNEVDNMKNTIDIRPKTDIYAIFKNLSYEIWYAISEFVDNSTASFFMHEEELIELDDFEELKININYDKDTRTLRVEDNAYGMEVDDFTRAIKLKSPPEDTSGRNEFGMGLKTSAFWFGKKLSIRTTKLNSNNEYSLVLDTEKLESQTVEEISYDVSKVPSSKHGTVIEISGIHNKRELKHGATINRVKEELTTIYKRDMLGLSSKNNNYKVNIVLKGDELKAKEHEFYETYPKTIAKYKQFRKANPQVEAMDLELGDKVFKDIEFSVFQYGNEYEVTARIGVLEKGKASAAGFVLYRRNRVIEGGPGNNAKPKNIFGAPNSFESQRIYGEINLDNVEVSQAKDRFAWDEELKEMIFDEIKNRIPDMIFLANSIKKNDKLVPGDEVEKANLDKIVTELSDEKRANSEEELTSIIDQEYQTKVEEFRVREDLTTYEEAESKIVESTKTKKSKEPYNFDGLRYRINYTNSGKYVVLNKSEAEDADWEITINISHDAFSNFVNGDKNDQFLKVISKIAIAIAHTEIALKSETASSNFRIKFNKYLDMWGDKDDTRTN